MRDFYNKEPDRKEVNRDTVVFYDIIESLVGKDATGGANECLQRFVQTNESRFATPAKERLRATIAIIELLIRGIADEQTRMNRERDLR